MSCNRLLWCFRGEQQSGEAQQGVEEREPLQLLSSEDSNPPVNSSTLEEETFQTLKGKTKEIKQILTDAQLSSKHSFEILNEVVKIALTTFPCTTEGGQYLKSSVGDVSAGRDYINSPNVTNNNYNSASSEDLQETLRKILQSLQNTSDKKVLELDDRQRDLEKQPEQEKTKVKTSEEGKLRFDSDLAFVQKKLDEETKLHQETTMLLEQEKTKVKASEEAKLQFESDLAFVQKKLDEETKLHQETTMLLEQEKTKVKISEEAKLQFESDLAFVQKKLDEETKLHQERTMLLEQELTKLSSFTSFFKEKPGIFRDKNWPLLHWASLRGDLHFVKFLHQQGADLNAKDEFNRTPLHCASGQGHLDVVKFLHQEGADLNAKDEYNKSPLHWASLQDVVKYLKDNGGH